MRTLHGIWIAFMGGATLVACGSDGTVGETSVASPSADAPLKTRPREQLEALRTLQATRGAEYFATQEGSARIATNPARRLGLRFDASGLRLSGALPSEEATWSSSLSFEGIGRDRRVETRNVLELTGGESRVEYRREGDVREWYENGPLGVEQGFSIGSAPSGVGNVEIRVAVDGDLAPEQKEPGVSAQLVDPEGNGVLEVSDLFVTDATGRVLPSLLDVRGGRLVLAFDDRDAAYPIEVDPLVSTPQGKLLPNANQGSQTAGFSVAISGDLIALGAPYDATVARKGGSTYVYRRSGASWVQEQKIEGGPIPQALFGWSVALSGTTLAIGAAQEASTDGAVYVYTRAGTTWTLQQRLQGSVIDGNFGRAVALSGDYLLVGAPVNTTSSSVMGGSAYLYRRTSGVWAQVTSATESEVGARLGWGVAVDGTTSVLGSSMSDVAGADAGQVFIKLLSGTTWTNQHTYKNASAADGLGTSVAISGNTAVFGAPGDDDGDTNAGTARVLVRSGTTWGSERILRPTDPLANGGFGTSVAVSGDTIVAGTVGGAAYVFRRSGSDWVQDLKLTPTVPPPSTLYGNAVGINAGTVVVGDAHDSDRGSFAGAGYAYVVKLNNGSACAAAAACVSGFCVDGVCCNTACGAGAATDCQACSTAKGAATNGTCANLPSTTTCRAAQSVCDVAEKCTGTSATCPANAVVPVLPLVTCRPSINPLCDPAENCDGVNATCPADVRNFPLACP